MATSPRTNESGSVEVNDDQGSHIETNPHEIASMALFGLTIREVEVETLAKGYMELREALVYVRADSQQAIGWDDPFGSQGPPILVGANAYFALVAALKEMTQEEARNADNAREEKA